MSDRERERLATVAVRCVNVYYGLFTPMRALCLLGMGANAQTEHTNSRTSKSTTTKRRRRRTATSGTPYRNIQYGTRSSDVSSNRQRPPHACAERSHFYIVCAMHCTECLISRTHEQKTHAAGTRCRNNNRVRVLHICRGTCALTIGWIKMPGIFI